MPPTGFPSQPEPTGARLAGHWFATGSGRAVLDSEDEIVRRAAEERPGQPWLRLMPVDGLAPAGDRELALFVAGGAFHGAVRCALPLPLASESLGTVVVQHVADGPVDAAAVFEEAARVLVPGGRLVLRVWRALERQRR